MKALAAQFANWQEALENFQKNVEKDLDEIRRCKREVQQMKIDLIDQMEQGQHAAGLAGVFHLAIQEAFRVREQPVCGLKPIALAYILPEAVAEDGGYGHCASALFGLWR